MKSFFRIAVTFVLLICIFYGRPVSAAESTGSKLADFALSLAAAKKTRKKINEDFRAAKRAAGEPVSDTEEVIPAGSWCAYFARYCMTENGLPFPTAEQIHEAVPDIPDPSPVWVPHLVKYYKAIGLYQYKNSYTPKPGDLVFYDFLENNKVDDHVGIVIGVNSDGTLRTVEGNRKSVGSQNVHEFKKQSTSQVLGYASVHKVETMKETLLDHYWSSGVQAPMIAEFFADGTMKEYSVSPGGGQYSENYSVNKDSLVELWTEGTYKLTSDSLTVIRNIRGTKYETVYRFHDKDDPDPKEPGYDVAAAFKGVYHGKTYFYEKGYTSQSGKPETIRSPEYFGCLQKK